MFIDLLHNGDIWNNVRMDLAKGITILPATNNTSIPTTNSQQQDDAWSTGIAIAIVTGTVSRYHNASFLFLHRRRVLLSILMGALAIALLLITILSCQFMTILQTSNDGSQGVFQVGPRRYLSINPS